MTTPLTIEALETEIARVQSICKIQYGGLVVEYAAGDDEYSADGEPQVRIADDQAEVIVPVSRALDEIRSWADSWIDSDEEREADEEISTSYGYGDPAPGAEPITSIRARVRAKWQVARDQVARG